MTGRFPQQGFTLIELVIAMVLFGILLAIAVPSFVSLMDSTRVKRAGDAISSFMVNAKSEAVKRNKSITVVFQTSGGHATWCAGMAEITDCDCTGADASKLCRLDGVDRILAGSDTYRNILLTRSDGITSADGSAFTFTPIRGAASAGSVQAQSANGLKVRVVVSGTGRIRICSPSGSGYVGGYGTC